MGTHVLVLHVQELLKLDAPIRERAERPLLLEVGGDLGVGNGGISLSIAPANVRQPSALLLAVIFTVAALTILRVSLAGLRWD